MDWSNNRRRRNSIEDLPDNDEEEKENYNRKRSVSTASTISVDEIINSVAFSIDPPTPSTTETKLNSPSIINIPQTRHHRRHSADEVLTKSSSKHANPSSFLKSQMNEIQSKLISMTDERNAMKSELQHRISTEVQSQLQLKELEEQLQFLSLENEEMRLQNIKLNSSQNISQEHRKHLERDLNAHILVSDEIQEQQKHISSSLKLKLNQTMNEISNLSRMKLEQESEIESLIERNIQISETAEETIDGLSKELAEDRDSLSLLRHSHSILSEKYVSLKIKYDKKSTEMIKYKNKCKKYEMNDSIIDDAKNENIIESNSNDKLSNESSLYRKYDLQTKQLKCMEEHLIHCKLYLKQTLNIVEQNTLLMKSPSNYTLHNIRYDLISMNKSIDDICVICQHSREFLGIVEHPPTPIHPSTIYIIDDINDDVFEIPNNREMPCIPEENEHKSILPDIPSSVIPDILPFASNTNALLPTPSIPNIDEHELIPDQPAMQPLIEHPPIPLPSMINTSVVIPPIPSSPDPQSNVHAIGIHPPPSLPIFSSITKTLPMPDIRPKRKKRKKRIKINKKKKKEPSLYEQKRALIDFFTNYGVRTNWKKGNKEHGIQKYILRFANREPLQARMTFLYSMTLYLGQIVGINKRCITHAFLLFKSTRAQIDTLADSFQSILRTLFHHQDDKLWKYVFSFLYNAAAYFKHIQKFVGSRTAVQIVKGGRNVYDSIESSMSDEYRRNSSTHFRKCFSESSDNAVSDYDKNTYITGVHDANNELNESVSMSYEEKESMLIGRDNWNKKLKKKRKIRENGNNNKSENSTEM